MWENWRNHLQTQVFRLCHHLSCLNSNQLNRSKSHGVQPMHRQRNFHTDRLLPWTSSAKINRLLLFGTSIEHYTVYNQTDGFFPDSLSNSGRNIFGFPCLVHFHDLQEIKIQYSTSHIIPLSRLKTISWDPGGPSSKPFSDHGVTIGLMMSSWQKEI